MDQVDPEDLEDLDSRDGLENQDILWLLVDLENLWVQEVQTPASSTSHVLQKNTLCFASHLTEKLRTIKKESMSCVKCFVF